MPSAPSFCARGWRTERSASVSASTPQMSRNLGSMRDPRLLRPCGERRLWFYPVLRQKSVELVGSEVRQHEVAGHQRGRVALAGKLAHFIVQRARALHVDELILVALLVQRLDRHHAPRAPGF